MRQQTYTDAKWHDRLLAWIIDQLGASLCTGFILALLITFGLVELRGTPEEPVLDQSALLVKFLCFTTYHLLSTSGRWQSTPGQRLAGVHIIRTNGRTITKSLALERYLAFVMPFLPLYAGFLPEKTAGILVIWLCIFWFTPILYAREKQGMHDRICLTRVVAGKTKND